MNAPNNTIAEPLSPPISEGQQISSPGLHRRRLRVNGLRLLFLVLIIGGWEFAARFGIIDPFFWGQPSGIVAQIVTWATQGTAQGPLWKQIFVTLEEAVVGFVIGVVLGVIFGVVLGRNHFLADVLGPFIKAANSIPRIVLGSVFVIALGFDIQSKVALAVVMVFFIVFFNAFQGVREVDRNLLANARILGASQRRLTTAVIIPSALTWIIASLHTSFSFALVGAVVGEYLGATEGLGLLVQNAQGIFNNNGVFAVMLILTAIALSAEALITALEHRLIRWRQPTTANDVPL
jgi:NitT/TauT family transport system permease protein